MRYRRALSRSSTAIKMTALPQALPAIRHNAYCTPNMQRKLKPNFEYSKFYFDRSKSGAPSVWEYIRRAVCRSCPALLSCCSLHRSTIRSAVCLSILLQAVPVSRSVSRSCCAVRLSVLLCGLQAVPVSILLRSCCGPATILLRSVCLSLYTVSSMFPFPSGFIGARNLILRADPLCGPAGACCTALCAAPRSAAGYCAGCP